MALFTITRMNGRSNAEVLVALVEAVEPGHVFSYAELTQALSEGTTRPWGRTDVQQAVNIGRKKVLQRTRRVLVPVRNIGYKVSVSSEHTEIARRRESKASVQIAWALQTLQNTNMNELSEAQRQVHDAHLALTGFIAQQVTRLAKRQNRQDDLLADLHQRVSKLEGHE